MVQAFGSYSLGTHPDWEKVRERRELRENTNVSEGSTIGVTQPEDSISQSGAATSNLGSYGSDSVDFGIFSEKSFGTESTQGLGRVAGGGSVEKAATPNPAKAVSATGTFEGFDWRSQGKFDTINPPKVDAEFQYWA